MVYLPLIMNGNKALNNGDFEAGNDDSWTLFSSSDWEDEIIFQGSTMYGVPAHSGEWLAWLGGLPDEITQISQDVFIKPGETYLHYWYWIDSLDSCGFDFYNIRINHSITPIFTKNLCTTTHMTGWAEAVLNLPGYAGSTINLMFEVTTDDDTIDPEYYDSSVFLDDIAFKATP